MATDRPEMIACVDVDYRWNHSVAACVVLDAWSDPSSRAEHIARVEGVDAYDPDAFERRELPGVLAALARVVGTLTCVVVDGYVWRAEGGIRGLGAHLHDALGGAVVVVGVAKNPLPRAPAREVLRGAGSKPLWVSVAGASLDDAVAWVRMMHGAHRTPTALARVDLLCRGAHAP